MEKEPDFSKLVDIRAFFYNNLGTCRHPFLTEQGEKLLHMLMVTDPHEIDRAQGKAYDGLEYPNFNDETYVEKHGYEKLYSIPNISTKTINTIKMLIGELNSE